MQVTVEYSVSYHVGRRPGFRVHDPVARRFFKPEPDIPWPRGIVVAWFANFVVFQPLELARQTMIVMQRLMSTGT